MDKKKDSQTSPESPYSYKNLKGHLHQKCKISIEKHSLYPLKIRIVKKNRIKKEIFVNKLQAPRGSHHLAY